MITQQCPGCGRGVEVASPEDGWPSACPHCGSLFAPWPGAVLDTPASGEQATQMTPASGAFPFLAAPRQKGELGWLGPYRVVKLIGTGGMGVVFQAEDTNLERPVALKVMNA